MRSSSVMKDQKAPSRKRGASNVNLSLTGGLNDFIHMSASKKKKAMATPTIAFDNADICDIDNQLSLNMKVSVKAPTIVKKTTKTAENTTASNSSAGPLVL